MFLAAVAWPNNGKMYYNTSNFEVQVDDKWIFLTEKDQSIYITQRENPPERSTRHKGHIKKVMFLAAVAEWPNNGKMYYNTSNFEVQVDDKWFFLTEKDQSIYITQRENPPERSTRHKGHIKKVMFLAAVARPKFHSTTRECIFDGKIGIWPFPTKERATRRSRHMEQGTWMTKNMVFI
jgi:hypothetical protein